MTKQTSPIAAMVQQTLVAQETKPVAKKAPATRTTRATTKAATKPVTKKATAKKAPTASIKFYVQAGRRPMGNALFHYTQSWLELSGMADGKGYAKASAQKVAGHTAVNYHLREGSFKESNGDLFLTAAGTALFASRMHKLSRDTIDAWKAIFKTGKADGSLVKNQESILPV